MKVDVAELRRITSRLFDHLEREGVSSVELKHDHYWIVPQESRYDVYSQPGDLNVGQLSADLESLRELADPSEPVVSYAFVWLAAILHEIGEQEVR